MLMSMSQPIHHLAVHLSTPSTHGTVRRARSARPATSCGTAGRPVYKPPV